MQLTVQVFLAAEWTNPRDDDQPEGTGSEGIEVPAFFTFCNLSAFAYTALIVDVYSQKIVCSATALAEAGIRPSLGTVGAPCGNVLAKTVNGLYEAENHSLTRSEDVG